MFGRFANRALSKKTTGLDKVAKSMVAKQAPPPAHDPELEHPDEWDRPID